MEGGFRVLGLDTTTLGGSVALLEGDLLVALYTLRIPLTHSERVLEAVERVLEGARWDIQEIRLFAVALGPGSFTGIRIGIGLVEGLSLALGRPAVGISSLEALAASYPQVGFPIVPLLGARRGEVYWARFRWREGKLERHSPDALDPVPQVLTRLARRPGRVLFVGEGAWIYRREIQEAFGPRAHLPQPPTAVPTAVQVARLGLERFQRGEGVQDEILRPAYLQPFPRYPEASLVEGGRGSGSGPGPHSGN